jgi:hypothetical protein
VRTRIYELSPAGTTELSVLSKLVLSYFAALIATTCGARVYLGKEWHARPYSASRPGGPAAKREPSPEGLRIEGV